MITQQQLDRIQDPQVRDVLQRLFESLADIPLLDGNFEFFEIEFTGAVTNLKYPHNLGVVPKDIIQTFKTGAGTITWNYDGFDATNLDITTSGACKVRAFIGRYRES